MQDGWHPQNSSLNPPPKPLSPVRQAQALSLRSMACLALFQLRPPYLTQPEGNKNFCMAMVRSWPPGPTLVKIIQIKTV